eukprot:306569-Pelagomonas_calceolata.AAC.2
MPSFRADGRPAGPGQGLPAFTSHCLPHPTEAKRGCLNLPFGRVAKVSGRGCAGWARAAGVNSTGKQANLGAHAP